MSITSIRRNTITYKGQKLLISTIRNDGLDGSTTFETAALLPDGMDIAKETTATEAEALAVHATMLGIYSPKAKPEPKALTGKYLVLACQLKSAVNLARLVDLDDDGGTCNFDGMTLYLPRWNQAQIKQAAAAAGVGAWKRHGFGAGCYVFGTPVQRQANARTRQAEAMRDHMKQQGYQTGMYYQMD